MTFLITNDDGYASRGINCLAQVAQEFGKVVIMAPKDNMSGVSTSISSSLPLRVTTISESDNICIYACSGTPADCVKMGLEYFCHDDNIILLSGINYGSNASINIVYSGTMGAVIEGCLSGIPSVGFSLLSHSQKADFTPCIPIVRQVIRNLLEHPLPDFTALNVNIPYLPTDQIKGIRVCRQARGVWSNSLEKRTDPIGRPYWWMTGKFVCNDLEPDTDEYALRNGFASVVPFTPDLTAYNAIDPLTSLNTNLNTTNSQ